MIASGLYEHRRTHPAFGQLFKWHMLEEIEHRTVAFDLYRHLFGRDYWHRARMCWFGQGHQLRFQASCAGLMSAVDVQRHGEPMSDRSAAAAAARHFSDRHALALYVAWLFAPQRSRST